MVVRVPVSLAAQLQQMNVVDHDQRGLTRARALQHQLGQFPRVRPLRRSHPVEAEDRLVEPLDRGHRVDVHVDHRQVLVPVRGQCVRISLPAAPFVMATEMADDRRLPVARVAVKRRAVTRSGTA